MRRAWSRFASASSCFGGAFFALLSRLPFGTEGAPRFLHFVHGGLETLGGDRRETLHVAPNEIRAVHQLRLPRLHSLGIVLFDFARVVANDLLLLHGLLDFVQRLPQRLAFALREQQQPRNFA